MLTRCVCGGGGRRRGSRCRMAGGSGGLRMHKTTQEDVTRLHASNTHDAVLPLEDKPCAKTTQASAGAPGPFSLHGSIRWDVAQRSTQRGSPGGMRRSSKHCVVVTIGSSESLHSNSGSRVLKYCQRGSATNQMTGYSGRKVNDEDVFPEE